MHGIRTAQDRAFLAPNNRSLMSGFQYFRIDIFSSGASRLGGAKNPVWMSHHIEYGPKSRAGQWLRAETSDSNAQIVIRSTLSRVISSPVRS